MSKTKKVGSLKARSVVKKIKTANARQTDIAFPRLSEWAKKEIRRAEEARNATAARAHTIRMG